MTTLADIGNINGNGNSFTRWAKFGPYYAMFPIEFAFEIINTYSKKGDYIIDPFAGRFSSIFAGAALGRNSVGIEINPVGWLYGKTKTDPAGKTAVLKRLEEIYTSRETFGDQAEDLPEFFQICYCREVRKFLLSARENLDWRKKKVDSTLMSIILVHLHAKLGEGLSNQMRQTKAMAKNYSINWWKANGYSEPPEHDPLTFLTKKIEWRYKKGIPKLSAECKAYLGDSTKKMSDVVRESKKKETKFSLLFTSPPYQSVVNYHADQWLRLWMLKDEVSSTEKHRNRFISKQEYEDLLDDVFGKCAEIMTKKSTVIVRTDIREFTLNTTINALRKHFPKHNLAQVESTVNGKSQTELFNNKSKKKEVDITLTRT